MFHKIDLEGARAFVLAHADELGKARLAGILEGARPSKDVVKALEGLQRPDGGFPRGWASGTAAEEARSSLDATCFLLDQLRDLPPLTGSPMASRALSYLRRMQNRDGSWSETGAPFQGGTSCGAKTALSSEVPPWLEGEEGTAYLTANVTFTLLALDPTNRDPVNWGLQWLERYDGPCDFHPSFLGWAAACLHSGTESNLAVRYWERLRPTLEQEGTVGDLDWLLGTTLAAGIGGRYLVPLARLIQSLAERQQPDGGWPGGDRVHATLMALRALRGYTLI